MRPWSIGSERPIIPFTMKPIAQIKQLPLGIIAGILLMIFSARSADAAGAPVAVVTTANVEAYQQAQKGAIEGLGDYKVTVYALNPGEELYSHLAEKLTVLSPKAIVAIGSDALLAVKTARLDVPVVFCLAVNHPEWLGLPNSWAIPMHLAPEDAYDRIRQVLPKTRIAIPYNPERTGSLLKELLGYFKQTEIELIPIVVRRPSELGPALIKARGDYDALWILPDASFVDPLSVQYILEYAMQQRLPVVGYSEGFTRNGAVLSLAGNYEDMGRQAGELARRILSGERPPRIQFPRRVRTYVNLRVARILNLHVTDRLLALSDRIYPLNPALR